MTVGKIAVSLGRPAQVDYQPVHPGLMTDMYHPDSAYVAWVNGRNDVVTFDLYARLAPFGGSYLLLAGLESALHFVRDFRFTDEDLRFLAQIRDYDRGYLEELRGFRFTGEILAMPEGSIAFPNALVQLFDDEREAFAAVAQSFNRYTLLLDTYDARRAIEIAIDVAREYHDKLGHTLAAIRLDGGDLDGDSRYVRKALDDAGLGETRILASGDLD